MRRHQLLPLALLASMTGGCAGAATAPAAAPSASDDATGAGPTDDTAVAPTEPAADVLYAVHEAVPPLATYCVTGVALPPADTCEAPHEALVEALSFQTLARDASLAKLEGCREFPRGLVRALRAELGDPACADALVLEVVGDGKPTQDIPADIKETLVALGLGARLRRLAVDPPPPPAKLEKVPLEAYFKDDLFPWTTQQAQAIFVMAAQGTRLSGYARGVVAIEAGNADMRFVEIVRDAPLASEIAAHQEAKDEYYVALDELLEPRKARGRNAALVGLREMARLGTRTSDRVSSARTLLSKVYGGRRVNALDTLMLAPLEPEEATDAVAAIASQVPTAYAAGLIKRSKGDESLLRSHVRAHMQMGMPVGMRREAESSSDRTARLLLARAVFENGRAYFTAQDFQAVAALTNTLLDDPQLATEETFTLRQKDEARLLRALSVALSAGPKDAAQMIAQGPRFADALGNLVLLDGLAEENTVLGGRAAFNAAYLRELIAPEGAPDYWSDLGKRYLAAAKKLKGDEAKTAKERGKACLDIEKALRKQK